MSLLADAILLNKNAGTNGDIAIKAALQAVSELNSKTKTQIVALANLTDSSAGTPSTTVLAAISAATAATTDTSAASLASVNTALGNLRNDLATLNAKINLIHAALKA